jgi:hypothetical protein
MSYFAKIDENSNVENIIAAEQEFIDSGAMGDPSTWIMCAIDGSIRGRYPGIGHPYDASRDEFLLPKPTQYPSWVWNNKPGLEGAWHPPIPFPGSREDGTLFDWNEETQSWDEKHLKDFLEEITQKITEYNASVDRETLTIDPTKTS